MMVSSNVQHQKSERDEVANANGGKYSNELHLMFPFLEVPSRLPGTTPVFIGGPVSLSPLSFDTPGRSSRDTIIVFAAEEGAPSGTWGYAYFILRRTKSGEMKITLKERSA